MEAEAGSLYFLAIGAISRALLIILVAILALPLATFSVFLVVRNSRAHKLWIESSRKLEVNTSPFRGFSFEVDLNRYRFGPSKIPLSFSRAVSRQVYERHFL